MSKICIISTGDINGISLEVLFGVLSSFRGLTTYICIDKPLFLDALALYEARSKKAVFDKNIIDTFIFIPPSLDGLYTLPRCKLLASDAASCALKISLPEIKIGMVDKAMGLYSFASFLTALQLADKLQREIDRAKIHPTSRVELDCVESNLNSAAEVQNDLTSHEARQSVSLLTLPVTKASWKLAGIPYAGHTQMLDDFYATRYQNGSGENGSGENGLGEKGGENEASEKGAFSGTSKGSGVNGSVENSTFKGGIALGNGRLEGAFSASKGASRGIMLLGCEQLFVALLTHHIPLREVVPTIERMDVGGFLLEFYAKFFAVFPDFGKDSCEGSKNGLSENRFNENRLSENGLSENGLNQNRFNENSQNGLNQKIVLTSINPHCGDDGMIGDEDAILFSACKEANNALGRDIFSVLPTDAAFNPYALRACHLIIAAYHDAGLAPLKALYFEESVNITLGLPIFRISVSHGSAHDIAYQGLASSKSLQNCVKIIKGRRE